MARYINLHQQITAFTAVDSGLTLSADADEALTITAALLWKEVDTNG